MKALEKTLKVISTVVSKKELSKDQATGILELLRDYNYALDVLDRYDKKSLKIQNTTKGEVFKIGYDEARHFIEKMKARYMSSDLFGAEKDRSLKSSLSTIYSLSRGKIYT